LGLALWEQAKRTSGPETTTLLAEAVKACRAALEVYEENEFPGYHKAVSENLKSAEAKLAKLQSQ
jgi:hypothetical protein